MTESARAVDAILGSTARRPAVTRAAVRRAAVKLFAAHGYRPTTMADIGAVLGIRGPSLYKHVSSKQELLAEIMIDTMATLIRQQQSAVDAGGDLVMQLRRAVEAHVRYHATHREEAVVGAREIESLDEPVRSEVLAKRAQYEHGLRSIIEQGQLAGVFDVRDPRLVSYAILDMGMGLPAWYRADGEYNVEEVAYTYADMATNLLGVH